MNRSSQPVLPRILIVDDERTIADTLAIILRKNGFETTAVYSGEQAIEAARAASPDALIADVVLQGISGIDVALQVRALLPHCRVILIPGQGESCDLVQNARAQGHRFDVLGKPFHPTELVRKLRA